MADMATRDAYGNALADLGSEYSNIVVLDADLSGSTKTGVFAKKFPERFFNMGVAEQDMMGTAAGFATCGKIVFASTFAMFAAGRAWEPIRQSIGYPHLNVKICATHAGLSVGEDGASHQMIEDIGLMRVIPGMQVFVPSDGIETKKVIQEIVKVKGPAYVRLSRMGSRVLFDESYSFQIGKGNVIKKGNGNVCIFTAGILTPNVMDAAAQLDADGISTTVVNLASIKPIDAKLIVEIASTHKHLISVEEHSVIGGLGAAVSEVLTDQCPKKLLRLGLQDEFGQSGSANEVIAHYGLDKNGIYSSIKKYVQS